MNAVLRHFAIRFWVTALTGGVLLTVALPWWQRGMGIDFLLIPVVLVLILCFWAAGWLMNRAGQRLIERKLKETSVWERAGMQSEARTTYEQAAALFDSYWLSPVKRREMVPLMTARLARFCLSRNHLDLPTRLFLADYLLRFPQDTPLAEAWLEQMTALAKPMAREHETAASLSEQCLESQPIQKKVLHFFLANRRTDFQALQTYRRLWRQNRLPEHLLPVARLLLDEGFLDVWCVELYIQAFKAGEQSCLEGVVAAAHWLKPDQWNRELLEEAARLANQVDPALRTEMAQRFKPESVAPISEKKSLHLPALGGWLKTKGRDLCAAAAAIAADATNAFRRAASQWHRSAALRKSAFAAASLLAVVALGVVLWRYIDVEQRPEIAAVPPPVEKLAPVVDDPFTIQVAAYLKPKDAQRLVDQLQKQGLDAFWTEATSAQRKWYQVKVSHFATRSLAQTYGEQLKAKGVIEDFYVANYTAKSKKP